MYCEILISQTSKQNIDGLSYQGFQKLRVKINVWQEQILKGNVFWFRVFWRLEKLGYSNLVSWMGDLSLLPHFVAWFSTNGCPCPLGTTRCIRKQNFPESHMINLLFTKFVCIRLVFFASLWTSTSSRSINTQKRNLANIQPSGPHTWSITQIKFSLIARPREKKQNKWIDPMQKWLPLNNYSVCIQKSLTNLVRDNKFLTIFVSKTRLVRLF